MFRKQLYSASFFTLAFVALLGSSFYHLYHSPTVGITVSWDPANHHYDVVAAKRWSPLKTGDVIKRIGELDIGFHQLLTDNIHIGSRDELFTWLKAKRDIYQALMTHPVVFVVERGGNTVEVPVVPQQAKLGFLGHLELLHVLVGTIFFLIGLIVFYKQKATELGVVFFGMCLLLTLVFVTNATSLMSEMVYNPDYLSFINITNIASLLIGNAVLLHFSLLLPKKRKFLDRFPLVISVFYVINIIIAGSLHISTINILLPAYGVLAFAAIVQAFWAYRQAIERQQMRWVGAGFIFGLAPWILINAIPMLITGERLMKDTIPAAFVVCIPLSMAFAIQKYRLLDIETFLEGTFVYLVTLLLLGIVDLAFMGLLANQHSDSLMSSPVATGFLSVALAVSLYASLRDRVRRVLLRLFKRDVLNEADILASFADRVGGQTPEDIMKTFTAMIQETFRPEKIMTMERGNPGVPGMFEALHGERAPVNLWERSPALPLPATDLYVALPLGNGDQVHHLLLLGALPRGRFYSRHHWTILQALLTPARVIYENALLYQENLSHHNARLLEEQKHLEEKEKILKDLHDGIGGITTNISLLAELAQHKTSLGEIQGALATMTSLSRESLSEIRSFMQSLDPREATWEALIVELRHSGGTMVSAHQMAFDMRTTFGDMREEPGSLLFLNIIRIYKESLTNVIKHSRARSVKVTLALAPEKLTLAVRDDGIGLESASGKKTGRGISHMQARAAEVGGRLWLEADQSTCVRLEVPLPIKYPSPGMASNDFSH